MENDIILSDIFNIAQKHGFTDIRIKPICNTQISLRDYQELTSNKRKTAPEKALTKHIRHLLDYRLVFFLYKGVFIPDSRRPIELSHSISTNKRNLTVKVGEAFVIPLKIFNTGKAKWINSNVDDIGVVFIGTHLSDSFGNHMHGGVGQGELSRHRIKDSVISGALLEQDIKMRFDETGTFRISIDLVAEQICWFKDLGSQPLELSINVVPNQAQMNDSL